MTTHDSNSPAIDERRNIEINLGKVCNGRCVFCLDGRPTRDQRRMMQIDELEREIQHWADRGHTSLGLLGGEPTLHPEFPRAIAHARACGFTRITIATNGMRLARADFTDSLLRAGLTRVTISMHGHTAALEDRQTGISGSFERKTAAIDHLVGRAQEGALRDGLSINLVLNRLNHESLLKIQRFVYRDLRVHDLRVNFIRAEGYAAGSRELTPTYDSVVVGLMKAVVLNESHYGHTFTFGGFPYCVLPESFLADPELVRRYVGEARDLRTDCSIRSEGPFPDVDLAQDRARFNWQQRKRSHLKSRTAACETCTAAGYCEGVWKAYLEIYGESGFHPLTTAPLG